MLAAEVGDEATQNRALRRADWRFFLPVSTPAVSLCLAGGSLAQAVADISGSVIVGPTQGSNSRCDLAVVADPGARDLGQAFDALCPGGAFYGEWRRPIVGGFQAVKARLLAAGFTDIQCFWPWPPLDERTPAFWLPLLAPQAVRYFLRNRPPASSAFGQVQQSILACAWTVIWRLKVVLPVCVTARKPRAIWKAGAEVLRLGNAQGRGSPTQTLDAEPELHELLRNEWAQWGLGPRPKQLSVVQLTGGHSAVNKVVQMVFADDDPQPGLVLKFPRTPESADGLRREYANLLSVQELTGGSPSIPRALFLSAGRGQIVSGQTALLGQPLYSLLRKSMFAELARIVTDWLVDLAAATARRPRVDVQQSLVSPHFDEFEAAFSKDCDVTELQSARSIQTRLTGLPSICEQRDCSPWNIALNHSCKPAVFDWESAEPAGLPLLDLVYYLTYLTDFLENARGDHDICQSYRLGRRSGTQAGDIWAECLGDYCRRTGLDPDMIRPLCLVTWQTHALSAYRRRPTTGSRNPADLFLKLWREELHGNPS